VVHCIAMGASDDPTSPAVPRAVKASAQASTPAKTSAELLATGDWTAALGELVREVTIVRKSMGDVGQFVTSGTKLIVDVQKTVEDVRSSRPPPPSGDLAVSTGAQRPSLAAKAARGANVWGHRIAVLIAVLSVVCEFIAARYPHETGPLGAILEIVHVLTARAPVAPSSGAEPRTGVTLPLGDAGTRDEWSPPP
jgi:hypothetical protein